MQAFASLQPADYRSDRLRYRIFISGGGRMHLMTQAERSHSGVRTLVAGLVSLPSTISLSSPAKSSRSSFTAPPPDAGGKKNYPMSNWYEGWTDVTYPIFEGMTGWPGQPETSYDVLSCIHCGDTARVTVVTMSVHSGTHMDAPSHFLAQGIDISRAPIDFGMGPARVAQIDCEGPVTPAHLDAYVARTRPLGPGERLILRTPNSDKQFWLQDPFDTEYRGIGPEAAHWIAKRKLKMVGVDYLSVGPFHQGNPQTHRALMSAGVWIVEGIDLRNVAEGDYDLICLPLKLAGCDGSPVRILIRQTA